MPEPKPGRRVRGSASGRPIMALLDLLGRRMTLRILWELRDDKRLTFRALQEAADTNPSVLNTRLAELRQARLVAHGAGGYGLTLQGKSLLATILPLHAWADQWAKTFAKAAQRRVQQGPSPLGEKVPRRGG
jgi:DNA-binding HxlR family transcriptional regulator